MRLGLNVLAALAAFGDRGRLSPWPAVVAAALCYVGSAVWLYEKPRAGIATL
ncbi:MAG: hypothetical protein IIA67_07560, partial [Planctomycetes bacterium]|nr:hypothetical protein [Planctomycetota bacterium]